MNSHVNLQRPSLSGRFLLTLAVVGAGLTLINGASAADPGTIVVQVDKPGAKISPNFYGLMTEEINYSYDGGLYGELIQNRVFKNAPPRGGRGRRGGGGGFGGPGGPGGGAPGADATAQPAPPPPPQIAHWSVTASDKDSTGTIALDTSDPVNTNALTTSLKLTIASVTPGGRVAVVNDGYWGIPVRPNTTYQASFYAKASDGFAGPLTVSIQSDDFATTYASGTVPAVGAAWQKYSLTLKTGDVQPTAAARFVIAAASKGTLNLNLVSLFPPTYKNRPNGNRPDIMQLLADMKPKFLRFPGGNYVEGSDYANRFDWPHTIGPLEDRPTHNTSWGYRSDDGLGLLEFLEWCEDIDMEPVLAVFAGYTLNGQTYPDEFPRFVQEALDEIEYVTGDVSTKWGAERAKDGHPAPFKLTYVEIGNEDPGGGRGGQAGAYSVRFPLFFNAIKAKYPNIKVISTTGSGYGNVTPDVIDDHHYMNLPDALRNAHMYDNRPRTRADGTPAPRIFVGEWASQEGGLNNNARPVTPSFNAALTDAAFLTGLERNADLIVMECYAPLFVNLNPGGRQWSTDLIGYDTLRSFGSPSYYVQKMFANNKGDDVLPVTLTPQLSPAAVTNQAPAGGGAGGFGGGRGGRGGQGAPTQTMFVSSSLDEATGDVILKVVNAVADAQQMEISLPGAPTVRPTAKLEELTGELTAVNSVTEPMKVAPKSSTMQASPKFVHEFPGNTVSVIRISTK